MKKILAGILVVAMMAMIFAGCGSSTPAEENATVEASAPETSVASETPAVSAAPVKLKVGVLAAMTALPVVDIVNNGLDKQNGIEIELIAFTTGAPMNEAMAAGEIDASCIGAAGVFALANFDAKMVCEICNDTIAIDLIARSDSDIVATKGENAQYPEVYGSADSIRGKTVLCPAGTLSQYEVGKYLDVFGLAMDDIEFVPMEYAQAYQAFKTGEGDILATRSPQTYTAVDDEGWISIASLQNLKSSATAQVVVSNAAYTEKYDALVTLVRLIHETNDKLNSDVDYAATLMSDWFAQNGQEIDIAVATRQLSAKPFYGVEDVKTREFGYDFEDTLVNFMISNSQLEESLRDTVIGNIKGDVVEAAGLK